MCDVRLSFSAAWLKITNRCVSCSGRTTGAIFCVNQPNASRSHDMNMQNRVGYWVRFAVALLAFATAGAIPAAEIVIDSFSASEQSVQVVSSSGANADSEGPFPELPDVIGGARALSIQGLGTGVDGKRSASISPSAAGLALRNAPEVTSKVSVLWNRGGFGLAGADITDSGSNTGFSVGLQDAISGLLTIDFLLSSKVSEETSISTASVELDSGAAGNVFVPFGAFVPRSSSGGADPANVFSIQMELTTGAGFMGNISSVKAIPERDLPTAVPLPATLSLLMIGLIGVRFTGRRLLTGSHPLSVQR